MGLLKTATRAAVASSVHGRVQRRQQHRWSQPDSRPEPPPAARSATPPIQSQLDQLRQLGELRTAGVLTDAEFEAKKATILNG